MLPLLSASTGLTAHIRSFGEVVDPIYVEQFLDRELSLHRVLLLENVFVLSSKIFFFSRYIRRLVVVRPFSYTVEEADHSSISNER